MEEKTNIEEQAQAPLIDPGVVKNISADSVDASKPKATADKTGLKYGYYWGTGRRKSSIARVRIRPGDGKLVINERELDKYFARIEDRMAVVSPLKTIDAEKSFDIFVNASGGGTTGQAGAVRLGIARALRIFDETLIPVLREGGHLTRDSRMVERKKPGQKKARKKFQFSKR